MSTTSSKAVALQYSGVLEGRPAPLVLVLVSSAIDRGACIRDFSQYPQVRVDACGSRFVSPPAVDGGCAACWAFAWLTGVCLVWFELARGMKRGGSCCWSQRL